MFRRDTGWTKPSSDLSVGGAKGWCGRNGRGIKSCFRLPVATKETERSTLALWFRRLFQGSPICRTSGGIGQKTATSCLMADAETGRRLTSWSACGHAHRKTSEYSGYPRRPSDGLCQEVVWEDAFGIRRFVPTLSGAPLGCYTRRLRMQRHFLFMRPGSTISPRSRKARVAERMEGPGYRDGATLDAWAKKRAGTSLHRALVRLEELKTAFQIPWILGRHLLFSRLACEWEPVTQRRSLSVDGQLQCLLGNAL